MNIDELRSRLEMVRDRIDLLLASETDGAKVASLSREYRQVLLELSKLRPAAKGSKVDELAARRENRDPGTADPPPASRRSQPRRGKGVR